MHCIHIQDPPAPEQIDAAVAALRAGKLVVLPTETVYGLAADPANPDAVRALAAVKGRPQQQPFTHHLAATSDLTAIAAAPPGRIQRLLQRSWPGPLTVILPAADGSGEVGVRVPAHPFTTAVIRALGHSVLMTSANRSGEPPLVAPESIAAAFAGDDRIALLADAGRPRLGDPSAVVHLQGRRLTVVRPGLLTADELLRGAAVLVLFVCTGNTCRSPLAEVLAPRVVAEHLGIAAGDVLANGLWFRSAGIATLEGMPASGGSLAVAAEVGLALDGHRSTALTPALIHTADRIYCLSASHVAMVLDVDPGAEAKTALLHPDDSSVSDPFGGPVDVYRATRDEIEAILRSRVAELLALVDRT